MSFFANYWTVDFETPNHTLFYYHWMKNYLVLVNLVTENCIFRRNSVLSTFYLSKFLNVIHLSLEFIESWHSDPHPRNDAQFLNEIYSISSHNWPLKSHYFRAYGSEEWRKSGIWKSMDRIYVFQKSKTRKIGLIRKSYASQLLRIRFVEHKQAHYTRSFHVGKNIEIVTSWNDIYGA